MYSQRNLKYFINPFLKSGRRCYSLHPAIKDRIQSIQAELNGLNNAIADNYSNKIAIKISRLQPIVEKYEEYVKAENEMLELQELLSDPQLGGEAASELAAISESVQRLSAQVQESLIPPHPFADRACILEIRPGVGGSEAALFAADLVGMYQNYCLKRKWECDLISINENPNGGIIEAILNVKEPGSYSVFQFEGGVHRVQRIPETETKGRVHTSTAAVVVLPDVDDSTERTEINSSDLRIDVMRASGSGGQHVNTTESAVRIVHLPTNTVVVCQDERSQHKNKAKALKVLQGRLAEMQRQQKQKRSREDRLLQVNSIDRSDKSRTYNYPQNRITDHRSGFTCHHLDEVMEGNERRFNEIVDSVNQKVHAEKVNSQSQMFNEN